MTTSALVDLAVGASTSEQDIISNVLFTRKSFRSSFFYAPIHIPAGSRVTARQQNSGTVDLDVQVLLWPKTFSVSSPLGRVTTYGANTADSGGIQVDTGETSNTEGAYAEISASTTNNMSAMCICIGNQNDFSRSSVRYLMDVSVGSGTSEQVIFDNIPIEQSSSSDSFTPDFLGPYPVNIPSGTRLAVRAQSSTTSINRLFDVIIYGAD